MPQSSLTPLQQRQILFTVLGLIGLTAWFGLFLAPQQRSLGQSRLQLQELQTQVGQIQRGLAKMPLIEQQIAQLADQYQLPEATKPPEQQLPEMLEMISQIARRTQVRVIVSKPKADVSKLTPGSSGYLELPVLIGLIGGYHQVGTFLDTLERSGSLLKVQELAFVHGSDDLYHHQVVILFQAYLVPSRPKETAG